MHSETIIGPTKSIIDVTPSIENGIETTFIKSKHEKEEEKSIQRFMKYVGMIDKGEKEPSMGSMALAARHFYHKNVRRHDLEVEHGVASGLTRTLHRTLLLHQRKNIVKEEQNEYWRYSFDNIQGMHIALLLSSLAMVLRCSKAILATHIHTFQTDLLVALNDITDVFLSWEGDTTIQQVALSGATKTIKFIRSHVPYAADQLLEILLTILKSRISSDIRLDAARTITNFFDDHDDDWDYEDTTTGNPTTTSNDSSKSDKKKTKSKAVPSLSLSKIIFLSKIEENSSLLISTLSTASLAAPDDRLDTSLEGLYRLATVSNMISNKMIKRRCTILAVVKNISHEHQNTRLHALEFCKHVLSKNRNEVVATSLSSPASISSNSTNTAATTSTSTTSNHTNTTTSTITAAADCRIGQDNMDLLLEGLINSAQNEVIPKLQLLAISILQDEILPLFQENVINNNCNKSFLCPVTTTKTSNNFNQIMKTLRQIAYWNETDNDSIIIAAAIAYCTGSQYYITTLNEVDAITTPTVSSSSSTTSSPSAATTTTTTTTTTDSSSSSSTTLSLSSATTTTTTKSSSSSLNFTIISTIVHFTTFPYEQVRIKALSTIVIDFLSNPIITEILLNETNVLDNFSLIIRHGSNDTIKLTLDISRQLARSIQYHKQLCSHTDFLSSLVTYVASEKINNRIAHFYCIETILALLSNTNNIKSFLTFHQLLPWLVTFVNTTTADAEFKGQLVSVIVRLSQALLEL